MPYYAPQPMKLNNGTYRASDNDYRVAYGYTKEEAIAGLNDNITNDADALKRLADKGEIV